MAGAVLWCFFMAGLIAWGRQFITPTFFRRINLVCGCLLYTSDAADDLLCVNLGGRRIIKKQKYLYVD